MAATGWVRTSAELHLYGYFAQVWRNDSAWEWRTLPVGRDGPRGKGQTKRESGARAASRRWILSQPDAKAAHAEDTRVHWNGRQFDGFSHTSWRNRGDLESSWVGACGAGAGVSTNYPGERAKLNCAKCLELLGAAESVKAVSP